MHGGFLVPWICRVKGFFEKNFITGKSGETGNYKCLASRELHFQRLAKRAAHWLAMMKSKPCLICSRITTSALSAS